MPFGLTITQCVLLWLGFGFLGAVLLMIATWHSGNSITGEELAVVMVSAIFFGAALFITSLLALFLELLPWDKDINHPDKGQGA